jgi:HEAT repeat protein
MTNRALCVVCVIVSGAMALGVLWFASARWRSEHVRVAKLEHEVAILRDSLAASADAVAAESVVLEAGAEPAVEEARAGEAVPLAPAHAESLAGLEARVAALETVVRELGKDPVVRAREYVASPSEAVRSVGVKLLGKFAKRDADARDVLVAMLNDPAPAVRARVVETLASAGAMSVPALVACLEDADGNVREEALRALRDTKDPVAIAPLRALYERSKGREGFAAALALRQLGDVEPFEREVGRLVQTALRGTTEKERIDALDYLGKHARDAAHDTLQQALDDPSPRVREKAQKILQKAK